MADKKKQTLKSDKYYADIVRSMKDEGLNYVKVVSHLVNDNGLSLSHAWSITQGIYFDIEYVM